MPLLLGQKKFHARYDKSVGHKKLSPCKFHLLRRKRVASINYTNYYLTPCCTNDSALGDVSKRKKVRFIKMKKNIYGVFK